MKDQSKNASYDYLESMNKAESLHDGETSKTWEQKKREFTNDYNAHTTGNKRLDDLRDDAVYSKHVRTQVNSYKDEADKDERKIKRAEADYNISSKKFGQASAKRYGIDSSADKSNKRLTDTGTGDSKEVSRRASLHKQAKNGNPDSYNAKEAIETAQRKSMQKNSKVTTNGINGKYSYKQDDHSIWGGTKSTSKYAAKSNAEARSSHFSNAASSEKHYADNWRNYKDGSRGEANKVRKKAKGYATAAKSASIRAKQWDDYIARTNRSEFARYDNKKASEGEYKETLKKKSGNKKIKNANAKKNQRKAAIDTAIYKGKSKAKKVLKKLSKKK